MPDRSNLAPGRTLRLTVLEPPLLNYLRVARPAATGCASSGRLWTTHRAAPTPAPCQRCGVEFDYKCYRKLTALTPIERWWCAVDDGDCQDVQLIYLCRGVPLVSGRRITTRTRLEDVARYLEAEETMEITFREDWLSGRGDFIRVLRDGRDFGFIQQTAGSFRFFTGDQAKLDLEGLDLKRLKTRIQEKYGRER